MRANRYGKGAVLIGEVLPEPAGKVYMQTRIGGQPPGRYAHGGAVAPDLLNASQSEFLTRHA